MNWPQPYLSLLRLLAGIALLFTSEFMNLPFELQLFIVGLAMKLFQDTAVPPSIRQNTDHLVAHFVSHPVLTDIGLGALYLKYFFYGMSFLFGLSHWIGGVA